MTFRCVVSEEILRHILCCLAGSIIHTSQNQSRERRPRGESNGAAVIYRCEKLLPPLLNNEKLSASNTREQRDAGFVFWVQ